MSAEREPDRAGLSGAADAGRALSPAQAGWVALARWSAGRWGGALLMGVAGVAHTLSFAPWNWPGLQVMALAGLVAMAWQAAPRRAAGLGAAFGSAWLASGLWWLFVSLHDFGGIAAPLAVLGVLLLSAALALYLAAAMAAWAHGRTGRPVVDAVRFPAWFLAAELLRAQVLSGFPWLASGYAHSDGLLSALAPWVGVYGIGAVAAALAALGVVWVRAMWVPASVPRSKGERLPWQRASLALLAALALPLGAWVVPNQFTQSTGSLRVSLIQPNVAQDIKFDPDHVRRNVLALRQQLHDADGQLVVTPESVLPLAQNQLDEALWAELIQPFQGGAGQVLRAALVGIFVGDDTEGYVNSMVGVRSDELATPASFYVYGKRHLLPFGEFTPPGFGWLVRWMQIPLADQATGLNEAPFEFAGQRIRPLICYEDLFGEDFAAATLGPRGATVLANASNFAWFGRWMVQDQHLQFSRMRALELQRPFIRATNTGATTVIDHHGRVTHRLPALVRATLDAEVEGRTGATPYARWVSAAGLWPLWAVVLMVLGWARWRWAPMAPSGGLPPLSPEPADATPRPVE